MKHNGSFTASVQPTIKRLSKTLTNSVTTEPDEDTFKKKLKESITYYVLTTKKTEHHTNRCSSESQLKFGSGLLDSATQPKCNRLQRSDRIT